MSKILKKQQKDIEILEIDVFLIFILKNGHFYKPKHHFLCKNRHFSSKLPVFDVFLFQKNKNGHFNTHTQTFEPHIRTIHHAQTHFTSRKYQALVKNETLSNKYSKHMSKHKRKYKRLQVVRCHLTHSSN